MKNIVDFNNVINICTFDYCFTGVHSLFKRKQIIVKAPTISSMFAVRGRKSAPQIFSAALKRSIFCVEIVGKVVIVTLDHLQFVVASRTD